MESRCVAIDGRLAILNPATGVAPEGQGVSLEPEQNDPELDGSFSIQPGDPVARGRLLRDEDGISCCCGTSGTCTGCCATPVGCFTIGEPGDRLMSLSMRLEVRSWPEVSPEAQCPNRPAPGTLFDPDAGPAQVEFWSQSIDLISPTAIDPARCVFESAASIVEREYRGGGPVVNGDPRRCDCSSSPVACLDDILEFERFEEHAEITSARHWIVPESAWTLPVINIEDRNDRWREDEQWNANDELNARINELPAHDVRGADYSIDTGGIQSRRNGELLNTWMRILYSVSVTVELNGPRCDAACRACRSLR